MFEKLKNWWVDYKLKKSLWTKISDLLFVALVVGLLFPGSRMWIVSNFQRLTMWGPSELPKEEQLVLPESAYKWRLVSMDNELFELSDFKGKVIFVNFWATWCPPCIAEMPSIAELYEHYKNDNRIVFLLVTNEKVSVVQNFLAKRGWNLPVFLSASEIPKEFFSKTIPATFIVDKQGRIVVKEQRAKKWHGEKTIGFLDDLMK